MEKKRHGTGRRKIDIKKIENKSYLNTAFSKRRKGLFKKLGNACTLCGVNAAAIVYSPNGRPYIFANPSPDSVMEEFLRRYPLPSSSSSAAFMLDLNTETTENEIEEEEEEDRFWLQEQSVEELGFNELQELKNSILELMNYVGNRVEEMRRRRGRLIDFFKETTEV